MNALARSLPSSDPVSDASPSAGVALPPPASRRIRWGRLCGLLIVVFGSGWLWVAICSAGSAAIRAIFGS